MLHLLSKLTDLNRLLLLAMASDGLQPMASNLLADLNRLLLRLMHLVQFAGALQSIAHAFERGEGQIL